jgi:hypothetical protein
MLAAAAGFGVLGCFLRSRMWPALATAAISTGAFFLTVLRSDAASDLVGRGSTGRLDIYRWFVERVTWGEALVGQGMASDLSIAEEDFGWFVHHPHSAYLTQFLLTGAVGLALLLFVIAWPLRRALGEVRRAGALWLALIASGAVAVLFDCGQIFSNYSAPRIEYLLVVVPAALLMGRVGERGGVME